MEDIIEKAIKDARGKGQGKIISRDDIYNAIFKAGYDQAIAEAQGALYGTMRWEKQQGRQEVVEWIDKNTTMFISDLRIFDREEDWQARKKVWFNEKV